MATKRIDFFSQTEGEIGGVEELHEQNLEGNGRKTRWAGKSRTISYRPTIPYGEAGWLYLDTGLASFAMRDAPR